MDTMDELRKERDEYLNRLRHVREIADHWRNRYIEPDQIQFLADDMNCIYRDIDEVLE